MARGRDILAVVAGLGMTLAWQACRAADDERLARLAPAEQDIARAMVAFIGRMEERNLGRVEQLNGGARYETLEQQTDDTDYLVRVTRGPVVEKAGTMVALGKKAQPGRIQGVLQWSRFYSLDVHPKTPLVGMLHATIVVQFYEGGPAVAAGWLGVMNGTRNAEDMAALKAVTEAQFARYGKDPALYRKLIMKGTDDTVQSFRRRPDDSGVSFYGPPVFADDPAKSFQFISELFEQFTGAYLDLVAKHAGDMGTPADQAAQDAMRKRWLMDQLFSDPFSSKLVPFEVWTLSNTPPVIKF